MTKERIWSDIIDDNRHDGDVTMHPDQFDPDCDVMQSFGFQSQFMGHDNPTSIYNNPTSSVWRHSCSLWRDIMTSTVG